jgi:hypothetical protein
MSEQISTPDIAKAIQTTKPLKTLFLNPPSFEKNPPSFEKFDGGASSRGPATREIESYWYPVWLTDPAGMLRLPPPRCATPPHPMAEGRRGPQGLRVPRPLHQQHGLGGRSEDGHRH